MRRRGYGPTHNSSNRNSAKRPGEPEEGEEENSEPDNVKTTRGLEAKKDEGAWGRIGKGRKLFKRKRRRGGQK